MVLSFVNQSFLSKIIQKLPNKFEQDLCCVNNCILRNVDFLLVPVLIVLFNAHKKPSKRATFLDLRKAFDTVNHKRLFNVLLDLGFRGPKKELLSSYLSSRSQRVKIGNQLSTWKTIEFGVPHGSVLRPLLFVLYINEVTQFSNDLDIFLFTDDTGLPKKGNQQKYILPLTC